MKIYRGCEKGAKSSNSKPLVTDMTNSDPVAEVTKSKSRGAAIGKKQRKTYQTDHVDSVQWAHEVCVDVGNRSDLKFVCDFCS